MLNQIRILAQVVESGSFSKAGLALNMAPSSISRSIDSLEHTLQSTLFRRSTRSVSLTEEGEYFYQESIKLLFDANKLISEMKGDRAEPQGMLRISVFESFGNLVLAPLLPRFLAQYPKVKVEIDLDNHMVDLHSENIDIAIRIGTPQDSNLKARKLMPNLTSLVATPEYLAAHPEIKQPEDLQHHNCLLISHARQRNYFYFSNDTEQRRVPVSGNLASRGGSPLLSAALCGSGVLLLSTWMVEPYLKSQQLVEVLPIWTARSSEHDSGEIFAVYKGMEYPKPHIRAWLDFLVKELTSS
ncbi:LysR family transcriptional regulator [Photobacterium sanguinicancri]|uniref:Transcriptional regulator n=1 Tax=Photobacterium sanguinicancri TaxID=875932 RepID=A0ABX4FZX9_9GAMM|nr:LysR family transcriptional regulator [Photobacterium sanguinicancri]OZS44443.1 transcriptional regulator [Photobacterium sanguinicancri]